MNNILVAKMLCAAYYRGRLEIILKEVDSELLETALNIMVSEHYSEWIDAVADAVLDVLNDIKDVDTRSIKKYTPNENITYGYA